MQRLSGFDAGFLYMETPTLHMHTLKISILDPSTSSDGYSFERVKTELAARLHLLPPFRRRLLEVPLGLHHPLWVEDPDFDIDRHVLRTTVPAPGGLRELSDVCSEIASRPLDRARALWEVWVVEGLEHGHVGFVAKIHHSAADGMAAAELLANVFELDPDAQHVEPPATPWRPDRMPSRTELVLNALRAFFRGFRDVPGLLRRTASGVRAVVRLRRHAEVSPPTPFSAPRTSFNRALSPNRTFTMSSMALSDVRALKDDLDVTVNDIVLALCAGGLRRYLLRRGELPDKPLVAGVPVSTRAGAAAVAEGAYVANRVSNMFTGLPVEKADPVERVREIHAVTRAAKEVHNALGADMLMDWVELTPPKPFAAWMRTYSRLRLADRHRPPINLVVSNVPGPRDPLYIGGARLVSIYSMGPILEGIGLNVTVWSYLDQLNWGIVTCPELMPDLWQLVDDIGDELVELQKAAAAS